MVEYYRLSFLRDKPIDKYRPGAEWEKIYLKIDEKGLEIIRHEPETRRPMNSKLEEIDEDDLDEAIRLGI